jgi:lipoate-protein ligase A
MSTMTGLKGRETWRLLKSAPLNGAEQMALDELLFSQAASEMPAIALRLYRWTPPCLSIGYAQSIQDIDRGRLQEFGWDWIRRPTGGRAILHTDELTYSVTGSTRHPLLQGSVLESYRRISAGIVSALNLLGLQGTLQSEEPAAASQDENPICFEVPAAFEITIQDRKLVGSAQHRGRSAVLQHGTLPLSGDLGRIVDGLRYDTPEAREAARAKIRRRALTVEQALGHPISWEEAADAFVRGFEQEFEIELIPFTMPESWCESLQEIKRDRYQNSEWLERV